MDSWIQKSLRISPPAAAFGGSVLLTILFAYPVFSNNSIENNHQGEALFSQERPERIQSASEQLRKQYRFEARQRRKEREAELEREAAEAETSRLEQEKQRQKGGGWLGGWLSSSGTSKQQGSSSPNEQ